MTKTQCALVLEAAATASEGHFHNTQPQIHSAVLALQEALEQYVTEQPIEPFGEFLSQQKKLWRSWSPTLPPLGEKLKNNKARGSNKNNKALLGRFHRSRIMLLESHIGK